MNLFHNLAKRKNEVFFLNHEGMKGHEEVFTLMVLHVLMVWSSPKNRTQRIGDFLQLLMTIQLIKQAKRFRKLSEPLKAG